MGSRSRKEDHGAARFLFPDTEPSADPFAREHDIEDEMEQRGRHHLPAPPQEQPLASFAVWLIFTLVAAVTWFVA